MHSIPFPRRAFYAATGLLFAAGSLLAQGDRLEVELRRGGTLINDVQASSVATHPATPFLERSTSALIDLDLSKIDLAKAAEWVFSVVGDAPTESDGQQLVMARAFLDSLLGAGVGHVYVTGTPRSVIDGGPLVVIPCENPSVVEGLATVLTKAIDKSPAWKIHAGEKVVVVGPESAVDRVADTEGAARGDLILPLKGEARLDHTIVLAMPAETRAELGAFWPRQVPPDFPVKFSPSQLVRDVKRVVVTFRLPPEPHVQATIETNDASAAQRIHDLVEEAVGFAPEAKEAIELEVDISNVVVEAAPEAFAMVADSFLAPARESAQRAQTVNRLKHLGLAMHNYYDVNKHLPPRCLTDREGNPLVSWRVTLLPYLEQLALHKKFDLSVPWSDDRNSAAAATVVPLLSGGDATSTKTRFRAPVFPGSLWQGDGAPLEFKDVVDGTSITIALIHAPEDDAVDWADPAPWVISAEDPMTDVFGDREHVPAVFLDGAVKVLSKDDMTNEKLKAMLTFAGGELVE